MTVDIKTILSAAYAGATGATGPTGATGVAGATGLTGATGPNIITSTSANAFAVGRQGATNPVINVDASTASVVTGLNLKGAAAAGGMALSVTSSGTNENLTIDAKGSGTITLNGTATGGITLTRATTLSAALTYGGVTLSNAVTGTGNMVLSAGPTFTGTLSSANQTLTTTSANSLAVGRQGTTNPVLNVDASTASVVTGLNIKGAAAAAGLALSVTSSGTNENLTIDAKGSGTVTINGTATGGITLTRAVTMSSTATATSFIPTATGTTGLGLAASNTPAIYANSTEALRATSTQVTSQLKLSSPRFFTNSGTQTGVVVNTWYNTTLGISSQSPACFMFWATQPSGASWLFYQFITENGNGNPKTVTTTPTSNMEVQFSGATLQVRSTSSAADITYGWVQFMQ